ncbi:MAG TPA: hypothetical protein GXX34_12145 [Clostridia bacterium]|nr:hypothetical protein [Clostridia bacterium]
MKIAVATDGNTLTSRVAGEFAKSAYLLIVDMETMDFEAFAHDLEQDELGLDLARLVKEHDCEALITGLIEGEPFELLAAEQITRYRGAGYTAEEALDLMEKLQLEIICDYEGSMEHFFHGHACGAGCDGEEH